MSNEIEFCPECGIGLNNQEKQLRFCQNCKAYWSEMPIELIVDDDDYDDIEDFDIDEDSFQPCADCDLPDACADFGCAAKQGFKIKETYL